MSAERYFTGKPCKRGHLSERWVRTKICIECAKQHTKAWYDANRSNPTVMQGYRARGKKWRESNSGKDRQRAADWRRREPIKAKESTAKWRRNNLDKRAAKEQHRRAQKAGSVGQHSAEDVADILKLQRSRCAYCPTKLVGRSYHVDHIIALSRGGSNGRSNIQILCKSCNLSKGARDPLDFVRSRGGLI